MIERIFDAEVEVWNDVSSFLEEELEKADASMKATMQILVAMEEIFVNVAHYAYPDTKGNAIITYDVKDGRAYISIKDRGVQFDPLQKEDPDVTLSADDRKIGGLGIFMAKKTMDAISYEYKDGMNILKMEKQL